MKKTPMPKSKAKTAYGLLSEIARLALAEPKRIRMARWLTSPSALPDDMVPACGTVGCIGGWAIVLKGTRADKRRALNGMFSGTTEEKAAEILGIEHGQDSCDLFNAEVEGEPGGRQHARAVVKRIRWFQKAHAAQLKAKRV